MQFVGLRGGLAKKRVVVFLRGWYTNVHYSLEVSLSEWLKERQQSESYFG